nr:HoxN/HupN/NixA family nickel/cobalt transporter [Arboricoccus pini]
MITALVPANLLTWLWAYAAFADQPALMGTALLAWVFGLRHAMDADHIAAIDNVVRKLMQEGRRPIGVGFFFSLGHSSVVVLACLVIALTAATFKDQVLSFGSLGGFIGGTVSTFFLLMIGFANLVILKGVWRNFQQAAAGRAVDEESLDMLLSGRGFLARLLRPLFRAIRKSWHMYPLGFLFGLGFDTATEIGLLSIAATQGSAGLSPLDILIFPCLFTAGMALVDSLDSILMVEAYGWAFVNPMRKLWYNLTITAVSVVVALVIGLIQGFSLLADYFGLEGGFWAMIAGLSDDLADFGFLMAGIFVLAWAISALVYRWKRFGEVAAQP